MPTPEDFVAAYAKAKGLQWGAAVDELQDKLNSGITMPPDVAKFISQQESGLVPLVRRGAVSAVSGALTPVGSLVDIGANLAGYPTHFGEDLWNLPSEVPKGPRVPAGVPLIGDESIGGIAGQIVGGTVPAALLAGAPEGSMLAKVFGTRGAVGGLAAKRALSKIGLPDDTLAIIKAEKGAKAAGGLLDEAVATKEKAAKFIALNRKRRAVEDTLVGGALGGLYGYAQGGPIEGGIIGAATGRIGAAIGSHFANKPRFNERVDLSNAIEYLSKYYGEPISTTMERFKLKTPAAVNEALAAAGSPDIIPMTDTDAHLTQTVQDIFGPAPDNWTGSYGDWVAYKIELRNKAKLSPIDPADLEAYVEKFNNAGKAKPTVISPLSPEEKAAAYAKHKEVITAITKKIADNEPVSPAERQQLANSKKLLKELHGDVTTAASEVGAKAAPTTPTTEKTTGKNKSKKKPSEATTTTTTATTPIGEGAPEQFTIYGELDPTTLAAVGELPNLTAKGATKVDEALAELKKAEKNAVKGKVTRKAAGHPQKPRR